MTAAAAALAAAALALAVAAALERRRAAYAEAQVRRRAARAEYRAWTKAVTDANRRHAARYGAAAEQQGTGPDSGAPAAVTGALHRVGDAR